jgi:DNA-3-methyladenine glycosylase I
VKSYQEVFEAFESTLLEVGDRRLVAKSLEPAKRLEGKRFADDECYRMLVHIVFYSGFRADIVTRKLPIIDKHFPNYKAVAGFGSLDVERIRDDEHMIRHERKIKACIENARAFREIISKYGSFQAWLDSLPKAESDREILELRNEFVRLFGFLGNRTAFHFMTDLGMPVLKPDRVIERIFKRLGLVPQDARDGDELYVALIQEGRKFARATGYPIRYVDRVFVAYGQVHSPNMGIEDGICLERSPACLKCRAKEFCSYYIRGKAA